MRVKNYGKNLNGLKILSEQSKAKKGETKIWQSQEQFTSKFYSQKELYFLGSNF